MPMARTHTAVEGDRKAVAPARRRAAYPQHLLEAVEEARRVARDPDAPTYGSAEELHRALDEEDEC